MYSQSAVDAGARQAYEDAELRGCPLGRGRVAVAAEGVARLFLDSEELLNEATSAGSGVRKEREASRPADGHEGCRALSPQLQHTLERVSGSTSHMAFEAMVG